jgi:hypothetical protein
MWYILFITTEDQLKSFDLSIRICLSCNPIATHAITYYNLLTISKVCNLIRCSFKPLTFSAGWMKNVVIHNHFVLLKSLIPHGFIYSKVEPFKYAKMWIAFLRYYYLHCCMVKVPFNWMYKAQSYSKALAYPTCGMIWH